MKLAVAIVLALALATDAKNLKRKRYGFDRPVDDPERIVNGDDAEVGQFPYQAYFEDGPYICGASIIEPGVALTACHCCDGVSASNMRIDAGGINRVTLEGFQLIRVAEKTEHPEYNSRTFDNDVCILTLEEEFDFDGTVGAINLAPYNQESDHYTGQTATITGWGTTSSGGALATILQYAEVTIWSDEQCNQSIYGVGGDSILPSMICAADGDLDLHIDSCQGDSGGPMALGDSGTDWQDREQVGIVSWGYGCAENGAPGVYSDVAYLRDWIDDNNPAKKK